MRIFIFNILAYMMRSICKHENVMCLGHIDHTFCTDCSKVLEKNEVMK